MNHCREELKGGRHWTAVVVVLAVMVLLAACGDRVDDSAAVTVGLPSPTSPPTPTLAPGMPTAPPMPPTLAPGETPSPLPPTETAVPTATPTATPLPAVRLAMGQSSLEHGDFAAAAGQFEASLEDRAGLEQSQRIEALLAVGISYFEDGRYPAAAAVFNELLGMSDGAAPAETAFFLGRTYHALADYQGAVGAYQLYMAANPEMSLYAASFAADAFLAMGDQTGAIEALEAAIKGSAQASTQTEIRERLAAYYLDNEQYGTAAAHYAELVELAANERSKGRMNYLTGYAQILAGDPDSGYQRYRTGLNLYPRAYESYLGLVALIDAGYQVNEYQRGVVDYYAAMYEPAVAAFQRAISAQPDSYPAEAHKFLAWSYSGLGNTQAAIAEIEKYGLASPAAALIEKAKLYAQSGNRVAAVGEYQAYLEAFPDGEQAPFAAWWAAALTERNGDVAAAVPLYENLAAAYPWHDDASEALFRAGWLAYGLGDQKTALRDWRQAALEYPRSHYGAAAMFWLSKTADELSPTAEAAVESGAAGYPGDGGGIEPKPTATPDLQRVIADWVNNNRNDDYYALRARDIVHDIAPFAANVTLSLPRDDTADQLEAEAWLRKVLGLEEGAAVDLMQPDLAADPRLLVGEKLWRIGLLELAKRELESLRSDYWQDPLASYQLSLFFRDLGLYRSSILAAASLLVQVDQTVLEAPRFIGRLLYPVYYADLIVPLAEQYGFDPLIQFALVRQESLFESFARSGAAAQGLAQVIPDTGAYIAQRLGWPDFENEDLYKPYVGLAFGAYYLDQQLDIFDGHVHVALSAYNGGPGNAARWYATAGGDLDWYLETVDFAETRLYIERIYAGHVLYRHLYGD